jgi:E3 ubiquitin-protein ligase ATL4
MSSSSDPSPTQPSIGGASPYSASSSILPSLMIIAALLVFVFLASVAIHLLLRFLSDRSSSPPLPRTQQRDEAVRSAGTTAAANDGKKEEAPGGDEKQRLIDSLPLFTMASALAALPKSSPDCAVCLSPFTPDAELRLLPACRHAFHAACVDAWLRTTPSCPLCRAAVALPHPSLSAMLAAVHQQQAPRRSRDRSGSFVVEIGTVRGSSPLAGGGGDSRNSRTYSLGSFDYQIDEEVEAVVSRLARPTQTIRDVMVKEEKPDIEEAPSPPGETVVEAAGSSRGWLWEYVDRLASTAYTFPGRWSTRPGQSHHQTHNGRQEEPWLWDAQAAAEMSSAPGSDEEETAFMVLYRWIAGV